MKYSNKDLLQLLAILMSTVLLYLTILELRVALSGSAASAQTNPCTTATPTPSNPPSATPSATPTATPSLSPNITPSPSPIPSATIFLTEFMACPESGSEWIELYNAGTTTITVTNWQVIDAAHNKKTINGSIPPLSFSTFQWSGSLLNNAGDSFKVQTLTDQIVVEATYDSCTPGISFVYENGEWVGAIASPAEETVVSENSVKIATRSAILAIDSTDSEPTFTQSTHSTIIPSSTTPLTLQAPSLHLPIKQTEPTTQPNISSQPPKPSNVPAISVILGGILQLATGSYALYETYFKNHV